MADFWLKTLGGRAQFALLVMAFCIPRRSVVSSEVLGLGSLVSVGVRVRPRVEFGD
jgi:hypothetical protein